MFTPTDQEYARFLKTWDWAGSDGWSGRSGVPGGLREMASSNWGGSLDAGAGHYPPRGRNLRETRLSGRSTHPEFGAVQTEAGGGGAHSAQADSAPSPAAPIQPGAGDVGQGDLLPSKAVTAEEASAPPAPTQEELL